MAMHVDVQHGFGKGIERPEDQKQSGRAQHRHPPGLGQLCGGAAAADALGERAIFGGEERQDKGHQAARADDEKAGRDQMMLAEISAPPAGQGGRAIQGGPLDRLQLTGPALRLTPFDQQGVDHHVGEGDRDGRRQQP